MSTFSINLGRWMGEQAVPLFLPRLCAADGVGVPVSLRAEPPGGAGAGPLRAEAKRRSGVSGGVWVRCGIARATYRYLQRVHGVAFPILPKDDLDRDLGLDDDEVRQALRDLLDEAGREYLPGLIDAPLVKVVDLVRYVQASPRRSGDGAAESVRRAAAVVERLSNEQRRNAGVLRCAQNDRSFGEGKADPLRG